MFTVTDADPLQMMLDIIRANSLTAISLVGILWLVHGVNVLLSYRLNVFGIVPRHPFGLIGIVTSPFLHGDFNHVFFNSIPLVVFVTFILTGGMTHFLQVTACIMLLSGLFTWIFGRRARHIGASGVLMGYWSYLLAAAFLQKSLLTIFLALVSLYYFGGMFMMLVPGERGVSWEGHVGGFLAGIATLFIVGGLTFAI